VFDRLDSEYCALGQSLSFYEAIKDLGADTYRPLLTGLRDIVFTPTIADTFSGLEGFRKSLERSGSAARAIHDAAPLFSRAPEQAAAGLFGFTFQSNVGGNDFSLPLRFESMPGLPGRSNIIIGYNGTGKTALLANLAMVCNADLEKRRDPEFQRNRGVIVDDPDLRFGAIITVSYSAFDTFDVPDRTADQRKQLERAGEVFGYVYCGLRSLDVSDLPPSPQLGDRLNRLKSIEEITGELQKSLTRALATPRRVMLMRAIEPLMREPSFQRADFDAAALENPPTLPNAFMRLSTGHKIVLHIIVQLSAHLEQKSLLLFDEPESHLHPPLLAALLQAVNILLEARDSYAVIATHSPVALQEVPGRYVHVLERFGRRTSVRRPDVETFGENVGYLTRNVFNLDSRATDFHSVLERLSDRMTVDDIERLFDGRMSGQARAYVESIKRARG